MEKKIITHPQSKRQWTLMLLTILFIGWTLIGVWPLSCYETDSMHIIAGCNNYLSGSGNLIHPNYSYAYDMQPLVTILVVSVKMVFSFLTCEQIYCLLTAIAAFFFAYGCFTVVCNVTQLKQEYVLLALFLIPETYACAYYPNSTTLAAAFYIWGLVSIIRQHRLLSIILLCIAPLFRIDVLIVYPVILPLFIIKEYNKNEIIRNCIIYAIIVVAFVSIGYYLLKANPIESLFEYEGMNSNKSFASAVKYAVITFYTVIGFIILPYGLFRIIKGKKYAILLLTLLPMVLLHYMFRNTGCATKHYLYLLPFAVIIYSYAFDGICQIKSRVLKYCILICLILYLIVSVRFDFPDSPWRNNDKSEARVGPVFTLIEENKSKLHIKAGIGAGQLLPTLDEFMLATGNVFYPFYIHNYKARKDGLRKEAYSLLKNKDFNLLMLSWGDKSWFVNELLEDGWRMELSDNSDNDKLGRLVKDQRRIECYFTEEIGKNEYNRLKKVLQRHRNNSTVYIVEELENMNYLLDMASKDNELIKLSERCYLLK